MALRAVAGKMPALPGATARHRINDRREFLHSLWSAGTRKKPGRHRAVHGRIALLFDDDDCDYDNDGNNDRANGSIR
jgi:hypothetical protein